MLNKKLLAVAVTAAMTAGFANASPTQLAVDLDGTNAQTGGDLKTGLVSYAKELAWGYPSAIVENDKVAVPSTPVRNGTASYMTANVGFTIAEGTNKYVRIDLIGGATFESAPVLTWDTITEEKNKTVNTNETAVQNYPATSIPNPQSSIAEGGQGKSFVVFEVNAFEQNPNVNEDIPSFLSFYVEADKYSLPTDVVTQARYRLYEDAVDAQRANDETLKDTGVVDLATFVDGVKGDYTIENSVYASVDSEYTVFLNTNSQFADHDETNFYDFQQSNNDSDNDAGFDGTGNWGGAAVSATTASLGEVDTSLLVDTPNQLTDLDGGVFNHIDVVGEDPVITFTGDFSYGRWALALVGTTPAGESCEGGTLIEENALLSSLTTNGQLVFDSISQTELETNDYVLCVDIEGMTSDVDDNLLVGMENPWENGNRIQESDYSAQLTWDAATETEITNATGDGWDATIGALTTPRPLVDEMGAVIYDSITVDVPFMSTFTDYKQRFHLTNNGPTAATYMFEFTPEVGTTVTAGTAASGSIPAGASIVIQTADIIASFDGRSRTAALLHIGGEDEDIGVSAVITNPEKGTIDIQDLNANSIKARKSNKLPEANGVN